MKRLLPVLTISLLAGCATPYQEQSATQGAVIGAGAGAIIGAQSDQVVEGTIIGGIVGGLVGAMIADDSSDHIRASDARYHRNQCNRGETFFERARHEHELDRRINLMRQGISYCPENPAAHNDLGVALLLRGDRDGARMHFNQALRLDPQYYPARHNMERIEHYQPPIRHQPPRPAARPIEPRREQVPQPYNRSHYNNSDQNRPIMQERYGNQTREPHNEQPPIRHPQQHGERQQYQPSQSETNRNHRISPPRNHQYNEEEQRQQRYNRREPNSRYGD